MTTAEKGKKIRVHYTGTLDDGTVFDSSKVDGCEPLEFVVGAGQMIQGFDRGVEGMAVGETRTLKLDPADAYGEYRSDMVFRVARNRLPKGYSLKVGDRLLVGHAPAKIASVDEASVELDANHELAGKRLNFEVTLVEVL